MKLKRIRILLLIVIMLFSLTSCGDDEDNEGSDEVKALDEERVSGGELNVPLAHVKPLNPLLNSDSSAYYFNKLIFESLFEFGEKLEPHEQLVESYTLNEDGIIDIVLKKNVKWHDGENLKAEDVKFTIDTIKYGTQHKKYEAQISDLYKNEGILNLNDIKDVMVKNDREFSVVFGENKANIIETLTFPIIPSHVFKGDFDKALSENDYIPVGTGPFKQAKYEKLKTVTLESFDSYWGDKPLIKTIRGRILKDENLSLTSFSAGQIDSTFSLGTDWEKYTQDESVDVHEFPSRHFEFLAINSKSSVLEGEKGLAIRKAIAFGINRKNIISKVYQGHATLSDTPVNPNSYLTTDKLNETYKYNASKARKLLQEAGFNDQNNDGIYEDEDGTVLTLKLTTNSYNQLRVKTLDMISDDLKNIGIKIEKDYEFIKNVDAEDEQVERDWENFQSKVKSRDFEIALIGWDTSFMEDLSQMFRSDSLDNFSHYKSEKMDSALDDISSSVKREEKINNYEKAQRVFLEELPYVSLFFTNGAVLVNKKINGDIIPNYINIYTDIDKWFIPKKYQSKSK